MPESVNWEARATAIVDHHKATGQWPTRAELAGRWLARLRDAQSGKAPLIYGMLGALEVLDGYDC